MSIPCLEVPVPPETTYNGYILIHGEAPLRFVLKVFSVLRRWRARYSVPSGCLGRTVVQNLTPDVAWLSKQDICIIRRGACSAEGNLETLEALAGRGRRGFCRISVSYFGILVRIFKHRVRTVFSFPNACREVDVTRQQTKTNFQT